MTLTMTKKKQSNKQNERHYDINDDAGRTSACGNFVRMKTGATFKRTVLPSAATKQRTEVDEMLDGIQEIDEKTSQEID